ncbi:unnamed protein product [Rotaria sp. Silwood2]|nr:unnamed protein product [Rotaria sp. Silwood2]
MLAKLILFASISLHYGSNGKTISFGGAPNVTHLTPNVSMPRTAFLYSTQIDLFVNVYHRPINTTHKETLKVFSGNTTINSTDRCIALGISFDLWGQLPIQNLEETGNSGCDALWGKECSKNILAKLISSFGNIEDSNCGVPIPDIQSKPPPGCPLKNSSSSGMASTAFLRNGSFMLGNSKPTDPSKAWVYFQSDPSIDGDYNELMKYFVFTYFVGRPYSSDMIDATISCMSVFNKTIGPDGENTTIQPNGNSTAQLIVSGNLFIFVCLFAIFSNINS